MAADALIAGLVEWLVFFAGAAVPVYIVFGLMGLTGLRKLTRSTTPRTTSSSD